MSFKEFNLDPRLLEAIAAQGYTMPSPIQQQAIPVALSARDLLGCAQTGTGKTAAFVIPLLQQLLEEQKTTQRQQVKALILAPTRELALQISESVRQLSRFTGIQHVAVFGGVSQHAQVSKLRAGASIVVATPGRLKDLLQQNLLSLQYVKYLVLDEADRMLDMGFVKDVQQITRQLPADRQTLLFSATMPPAILQLAGSLQKKPVRIEVTPAGSSAVQVAQSVYFSDKQQKPVLLVELLQEELMKTVIVFTQMKYSADKLSRYLQKAGIDTGVIHGNRSQQQRESALQRFKNRDIRVLVATDIAARGIDVSQLECVINYDLPLTAETYVHRIGRTGRAGASGTAISFCSPEEKPLLTAIQQLIKKNIPVAAARQCPVVRLQQARPPGKIIKRKLAASAN